MVNGSGLRMELSKPNWFNVIKCKFKGHALIHAGSCPFTGMRYDYCERCSAMIPIDWIDE
jgi:hypothetical protein